MSNQESISTTQSDKNVLLQYLVEQFGNHVKELADQIENSYTKVRFKGERDELAQFVENMHYHPMASTTMGLKNGVQYLQMLVHKKLMSELFEKNKDKINYLYGAKKNFAYLVQLKNNNFQERDFFRNELFKLHDSKPYRQFLSVNLEFLPDDVSEDDLFQNEVVKLNLPA